MSASNVNKVTRQVRIGQVIAGIQKYYVSLPAMSLGGTSYTPGELIGLLQKGLDAAKQTSTAREAWMAYVQTERNTLAGLAPVLRYIRAFVVAQFGDTQDSSQKLGDFGFTPRKVRSKKVKVKAAAADKVLATRKARSTLGKNQKAKIKGTAAPQPTQVGSTATAPATPAASPAPAPVKPAS
jgi:hypothetical protein